GRAAGDQRRLRPQLHDAGRRIRAGAARQRGPPAGRSRIRPPLRRPPPCSGEAPMTPLDRRQLLRALAPAGAVALAPGGRAAERDRNRVKAENEREGTSDWQLTYTRVDPKTKCTRFGGGLGGRSTTIEGYVSRTSARAGDKLDVFVSADPASAVTL